MLKSSSGNPILLKPILEIRSLSQLIIARGWQLRLYESKGDETLMVSSLPPVHVFIALINTVLYLIIRFRQGGAQRGRWNNSRGGGNASAGGANM